MFCRNCGKQISDTANYCMACGVKAEAIGVSAASKAGGKPVSKKSRLWAAGVVLLMTVLLTASVLEMSIPEIIGAVRRGEPLTNRALYDLETALQEKQTEITIYRKDWDTDICSWGQAEVFLIDYIIADPEKYYIDGEGMVVSAFGRAGIPEYYVFELAYYEELTTNRAAQRLEAAADAFLESIPADATDWEKALHLHDALIRHVTYEKGDMDSSVYGALVNGKAVCMGYAMAYEYLLKRADIECDTVIGYADEFSAAMDGTLLQMDQHAWTIVTFRENGVERSYYVDTTWDDLGIKDIYGREYISRQWFCVTQKDIYREGRTTLQEGYDMSRWNLSDDAMNYYVYTGSMIDHYDLNEVIRIMQAQMLQGSNCLSLRMADMDTHYALSFAMDNSGDFQKLCEALGISSCAYNYSYSYSGDGLLCFNIYLNYPEE